MGRVRSVDEIARAFRWALTVAVVVFASASLTTHLMKNGSATAMTHEQNTGTADSTQARVLVEVGTEHFEPGRTRIEVRADGRTLVTNRLHGKEDRGEVTMDVARFEPMLREARDQMPRVAQRSTRRGIPDEPRYHIELEQDGRKYSADLWRSELEEMPALHRLVRELETVARRAINDRLAM